MIEKQPEVTAAVIDTMVQRLKDKPEGPVDRELYDTIITLIKGYADLAMRLYTISQNIEVLDGNIRSVAGGIGTLVEYMSVKRLLRLDDLESFERARLIDSNDAPETA